MSFETVPDNSGLGEPHGELQCLVGGKLSEKQRSTKDAEVFLALLVVFVR